MAHALVALRRKKRREKTSNFIVMSMLFAILGYLGYIILPIYAAQGTFQEGLLDLVSRSEISQQDTQSIVQQVVELGQARQFSVQAENVRVYRFQHKPDIDIVVDYTKTREFPGGFIYVFYFRSGTQDVL